MEKLLNTFSRFQHYVGIDYSGAAAPTTRLPGLRVFRATQSEDSVKVVDFGDVRH